MAEKNDEIEKLSTFFQSIIVYPSEVFLSLVAGTTISVAINLIMTTSFDRAEFIALAGSAFLLTVTCILIIFVLIPWRRTFNGYIKAHAKPDPLAFSGRSKQRWEWICYGFVVMSTFLCLGFGIFLALISDSAAPRCSEMSEAERRNQVNCIVEDVATAKTKELVFILEADQAEVKSLIGGLQNQIQRMQKEFAKPTTVAPVPSEIEPPSKSDQQYGTDQL